MRKLTLFLLVDGRLFFGKFTELRHFAIGLQFYRPMATTNLINFGVSFSESIAERMHRPRYEWDLTISIYHCRLPSTYKVFL